MSDTSLAIATVLAAFVAGVFGLLGLIIGKEQEVSKFRQAWIDALRQEVADLIAHTIGIQTTNEVVFPTEEAKLAAAKPHQVQANIAIARIRLRLNPHKSIYQSILAAIAMYEGIYGYHGTMNTQALPGAEAQILVATQEALKEAWERVKSGEATFRVAKFALSAIVIVAVAILAIIGYKYVTQR